MSSSPQWFVSSLEENDIQHASPQPRAESPGIGRTIQPVIPTHLFLHFDINETILLGDDAGGDSRQESAQKMLAKSAFCRIPESPTSGSTKMPKKELLKWKNAKGLKPTHWWDGQEIGRETSMPPLYTGWTWPENCCPYYRTAYKKYAKSFTNEGNHGQIYRPLMKACESSLPSPSSSKFTITKRSSRDQGGSSVPTQERPEGKRDHCSTILPAFYVTLRHLIDCYEKSDKNGNDGKKERQPPPFTIIFRTFGSDLSEIASVVTAFAEGEHPDYPDINFPPFRLSEDRLYQGRWKVITNTKHTFDDDDTTQETRIAPDVKVIYELWTSDESELVASGDSAILELLSGNAKVNEDKSSPFAIFGIRDDYDFWNANECHPTAGKPIWVPTLDRETTNEEFAKDPNNGKAAELDRCNPYAHHLLFDDNIHNLPDDGIACVRKESPSNNVTVNRNTTENRKNDESLFETVDGNDMDAYQGIHLVRVPTVEPVLNPHWYIQQIEKARERLQIQLQSKLLSDSE